MLIILLTPIVLTYALNCESLSQQDCQQNCTWNQLGQTCRQKTCEDLDFRNCTSINNLSCITSGPKCVAQTCSVLNYRMCQQYLNKSFNNQGQCTWSTYYSQCTVFQEGMECRSYLNQETCENNSDHWDCYWNTTRQLCNNRECKQLDRTDCEIFSLAQNSLNNNYCLWTQTNLYQGNYCSKYAFVTCDLIQTQTACTNPENAAQSVCNWNGTHCATMQCSDLPNTICDTYLMPNKTLNGQHCYTAAYGCERAPWNITCDQLTTEASCTMVDTVVGLLCSWIGQQCVVANCTTLTKTQCPPDDNPALVNGQYCVMEGSKCIFATCESINQLYTGVCNYFKEPGDYLNGHNCIYVKQGCQTITPKYRLSCNEIGLETACYYSIDSNNHACVWNASDRCDILVCNQLQDVNLRLCQEYQYPKRSANGYQCLQEGTMCRSIPLSDYGCKTFNQFPSKCEYYNYQTGPKMVTTCYYSTILEQCHQTNSTSVQCYAFADSQSECELPITKPYLNASLLCQFTNTSQCTPIVGKNCQGITNSRTCQIAQIIGQYPCQWNSNQSTCYEGTCFNQSQSACSQQKLCYWDTSMIGQEQCLRYNFEVQITDADICSQIGGQITYPWGVCMLRLCTNYKSLNSCVEATGHMNHPLNCYWKQSHVKVDQKRTSYDENSCQPKLIDDICQLDRRFLCSQLVNTVWDCRKLLPNYGWNSQCIKCSNITDQSNCLKTDSACHWVDNKCIGQDVGGPSYQSFHGCTSADWSLGFSPTIKKCFICALLQQSACSIQVGCEWIQNRCQGLRHNSAMMQSRQRCEVVKQFAFSRDFGCLDCSSQNVNTCEKQLLCMWDGFECIGRRSTDNYLNYPLCEDFGEEYGYDSYDRTCTNCLLGNCPQLPQCFWDPISQLCLGIRITNPNITYSQCINMGPEFGYTTQMSQKCVICSELTTITQCEQVSQICQWVRGICQGQRIENANTFYQCQNYAPDFGFDSKTQRCLLCRNISRQDCNSYSYCKLINGYCLGKQLSDYTEAQCLEMGIKYALDGSKCFDCSIQTNCNNSICRSQMISTNGTTACRRNRKCYTSCSQITEQLDCYDLIFQGIIRTCVWYNSRCVTSQCQYLLTQELCQQSYTQNSEFKQCYWSQDQCQRFECGYIQNQLECDSIDKQVTNMQCVWNQNIAYCSKIQQPIQCQSLMSNYSCQRSDHYLTNLKCKWVLDQCEPQGCSDITDSFTCLQYSLTSLNNDQMCLWSAGDVCKQYQNQTFRCVQVTTEQQCVMFDNCTWVNNSCVPYSCGTIKGESECALFSSEQIAPNIYCLWKENTYDYQYSCQPENNITCQSFQSQFSCQHGLGIGTCAWKNKSCTQAQCSDFNQYTCPCLFNGYQCVQKPSTYDCSVFLTRGMCLRNPYSDSYQCIWRQNHCQMGYCSLLINEKECNHYLTQTLNNQYCYWDKNTCLSSAQQPYCSMFRNSQTCSRLTYQKTSICRWETSECLIKSCSELSVSDCGKFPSGMPSGEYCDIYQGMCVTIGSFDCQAISDRDICLQTIFPSGQYCEWINSTCQFQNCKNYVNSCDCIESDLGCEYDYEKALCKPIQCNSTSMKPAKCFKAGCSYNYTSNTCMAVLTPEQPTTIISVSVYSSPSSSPQDEIWPQQYAMILIIQIYFLF